MKKENISDEERNMLESYITEAGAVRRGNFQTELFLQSHFKLMMLISRKFYRDFDENGPRRLDNFTSYNEAKMPELTERKRTFYF